MKKILTLTLALLLLLSLCVSLVACGIQSKNNPDDDEEEEEPGGFIINPGDNTGDITVDPTESGTTTYTFEDRDETVYVQHCSQVNYRDAASSKNSKIIGQLKFGTSVKRTGYNQTWSRVEISGKTYYVASLYLSTTDGDVKINDCTEEDVYVLWAKFVAAGSSENESLSCNLRKYTGDRDLLDGTHTKEITTEVTAVKSGEKLTKTGTSANGEWVRVNYTDAKGTSYTGVFIPASFVGAANTEKTATGGTGAAG